MKLFFAILLLLGASCAQSSSRSSGIEPEVQVMDLDDQDESALCEWAQQRIGPFEEGRPYTCWGWRTEGSSVIGEPELRPLFAFIDRDWVCGELVDSFAEESVGAFEICINSIRAYPERLREEQRRRDLDYERCTLTDDPCSNYSGVPRCGWRPFEELPDPTTQDINVGCLLSEP